ncbi:uncharacterized protein MELLADRAFT_61868 [Melampsora larici-populina 98AG31]|uniref:Uncharacterized protein n=1 Tax=Melampsora larici-populina (strain 98AG31 / pathotype 3-4-7) TaxID=747676 RepID=F4RG66_MELLP|nr:uncharacterized protein MELLADRAFT_61868 [Melampsora larici-populina 98AG31]EGG08556.1 hypothetical protein MELLADRAFT_61868 [Melampsora larici-populina 98AG31]
MSDIEKGKIDAVPPTNPTPPKPELTEKEKMKESHFWRKTAIYAGLAAFVVLVIYFILIVRKAFLEYIIRLKRFMSIQIHDQKRERENDISATDPPVELHNPEVTIIGVEQGNVE